MSGLTQKIIDVTNQAYLNDCDRANDFTAGTDVANLTTSTIHTTGAVSVEFDKTGTTGTTAIISTTFGKVNGRDLRAFALHKVRAIFDVPSLTNVASWSLRLGTDASNYAQWDTADTAMTIGFTQYSFDSVSPTSSTGNGIDWEAVKYLAVVVNFDAAGNTLNNMRLDLVDVYKKNATGASVGADVNIAEINGTTTATGDGVVTAGTLRTTLGNDDTQFGAVGSASDVDGSIHGQLRYIGESVDGLEAAVPLPSATHTSPNDFTATFTSNVSVTLAGYPTITDSSQIAYILYVPTGGSGASILINGVNGVTITESSGILTVNGGGTPFAASDVYRVGLNLQEKAIDGPDDVIKNVKQNLDRSDFNDAVDYTTLAPDDATYDEGAVLDVRSAKFVTLYWSKTASDADNNYLKLIGLTASAGTVDYQEMEMGSPVGGVTDLTSNVYEIDKAVGVNHKSFDVQGLNYIRFDLAKATDAGTDSTWTTLVSFDY